MASVAQGIGVHRSTLWEWIRAGTKPGATGLEADLADAITRARVEGEETLLQRLHQLAEKGDTRAKGLALAAEDCGEADLEAAPHGGPGDRATGAG
jgi:transposase-like protein